MKLFVLSFLLLFTSKIFAQQKEFPLDDRGKYIYYEMVEGQKVSSDSLLKKATSFVDLKYKKTFKSKTVSNAVLKAEGKSILDKSVLVANRPIGEISYHFQFEVKEGKYRFWLTDFLFIPYQRDRYGNYVASTTIGTPLETSPGKLNSGEWKAIISSAYEKSETIAKDFKEFLAKKTEPVSKKAPPRVVSTDKW